MRPLIGNRAGSRSNLGSPRIAAAIGALMAAWCLSAIAAEPAPASCAGQMSARSTREANARIVGSMLKYKMPGTTFLAKLRCPDIRSMDDVGFVQFVVAGSGVARYDGGVLELRHPHLPAVDATPEHKPWYSGRVLEKKDLSLEISMSDDPTGSHSLEPPYGASRHYPNGFRSSLYAMKRDLTLVSMLVQLDRRDGGFAVLDAYEWSTSIEVDVRNTPEGVVAEVLRSSLSAPAKPTTERMKTLDVVRAMDLPSAALDLEHWWIPPETSASKPIRLRAR